MDENRTIHHILISLATDNVWAHEAGVHAYQTLGKKDIPAIRAEINAMPMQRGFEVVQQLAEIEAPIRCDLMTELIVSHNPLVASHAIDYLSGLGETCIDLLLRSLRLAAPLVVMKMISVFKAIPSPKVVEPLIELLDRTESTSIRHQIIEVLGLAGDPSTLPVIRSYIDDEDQHVSKRAQAAVQAIERRYSADS